MPPTRRNLKRLEEARAKRMASLASGLHVARSALDDFFEALAREQAGLGGGAMTADEMASACEYPEVVGYFRELEHQQELRENRETIRNENTR